MKIYSLFDRDGQFFLREKNPLENSRQLVSVIAYAKHEAEYLAAALLLLNPSLGKKEYLEKELRVKWQFNSGVAGFPDWIDISEPNFIDTKPNDYRQVFEYIATERLQSYQDKVVAWVIECFGEEKATNVHERSLRFLEEALELIQATGLSQIEAQRLVTYVYNRPCGNRAQEIGGVMVTLASLSSATGLNMREQGDIELARVITKIPEIREKQQFKEKHNITA